MVEKRRTSSRIKAEPAAKRLQTESIQEKPKAAEKPAKSAIAAGKEAAKAAKEAAGPTLPTKVSDSKPLPVLNAFQELKLLGDGDYQTVKESGVLAAAVARSRQKWVHGGVFEKFWSKTKVTKTMTEEEKRIAKGPQMNKVGSAKLTAEPHVFDIVFYAVKDPNPIPKQGQLPQGTSFLQYGVDQSRPASPAPYHSVQPYHNQTPTPGMPNYSSRPPMTPSSAGYQPPPRSNPPPPAQSQATSRPVPNPADAPPRPPLQAPSGSNLPPVPPTPPAPDPVIHALAQRASTDLQLKSVMKIVATGKATQTELEYFQKHIDELTQMVKKQQAEEAQKRASTAAWAATTSTAPLPRPATNPAPAARVYNPSPGPHPSAQGSYAPPSAMSSRPPQSYYHQPAPPPRVKQAPPVPPLHMVVQFGENLNERYLFPKNCILEFLPGVNSVLCSFVVTCKGSDTSGPAHYDPKLEYWEAVTIQLTSDVQTLGMLGRYVSTADEARKHMDDVMDRCVVAEDAYLALRLPKEKGVVEETAL